MGKLEARFSSANTNSKYKTIEGYIPYLHTIYLANIFQGRIEYELIYSLRGAKHRVDYSVHIR